MRMTVTATGLALLLAACDGGLSEQQAAEAHDVATDAAYQVLGDSAAMMAHEARITQLEQRISKLEFCVGHPEATDC